MPDLATIGFVCRSVDCNHAGARFDHQPHEGTVLREESRKTQNKPRRELLRAARRYLLAAAKDLGAAAQVAAA
jgi:hypothetical protein